jgi:hypothetical protein
MLLMSIHLSGKNVTDEFFFQSEEFLLFLQMPAKNFFNKFFFIIFDLIRP